MYAISRTYEVFISFSITVPVGSYTPKKGKVVKVSHALRFLDSFQFMAHSLDALAKTIKKEDFLFLNDHFTQTNPEVDRTLLPEKMVFSLQLFSFFWEVSGTLATLRKLLEKFIDWNGRYY